MYKKCECFGYSAIKLYVLAIFQDIDFYYQGQEISSGLFLFFRAGITYVSVHDCYWTHPCDVDIMNKVFILNEC